MEPDKFEKYIKNKLDEREIRPSDNTWDRISKQLPSPETPKSNKFFWYGIAAAFIGVLMIASFYFTTSDELIESEIQIVETPSNTINGSKKEDIIVVEQNDVQEQMASSQKAIINETVGAKMKVETTLDVNSQIATINSVRDDVVKDDSVLNEKERLMEAKIAEVVAQVNLLENSNLPVTSAEVDSLLRQAQQEILTNKIFSQEGKVDAMALLNEVEGELDQTFREQIFETLKTGFLKVRTAVAARNN
jgi:hypothetical protein